MDMEFTQKLIQEIKKRPIIYSENHPDHRFGRKRLKAWGEIGKELDEEVHILKSKWKNLKDSYKKCNQANLGAGSFSSKKLSNWFWADYMRFIDASDDQAVLVDDESNETISNVMNSKGERRVENKQYRADGETERKKRRQGSEYKEERKSRRQDNRYKETTEDVKKKKRTLDVTEESYLQNKKINEVEEERVDVKCDAIDLLFLSYADTFKKLSRRTQISLKFELAKIFMEAELNDMNTLGLSGTEMAEDSIASNYCDPLDAVEDMKMEMNP